MKRCYYLSLLVVAALMLGCTSKPIETMRIGNVLWPGYEPLYTARSLGYYDNQPIKLIDYLSNTDAIRAFKNGALEACSFTLDETLILLSEGVELEIILIMDISDGGDVILANTEITSVAELKGKRLGVEAGAVGAYVGMRALELAGLKKEDVEIVSILSSEASEAFRSEKIDAAVSFEPNRSKLLKLGKVEIFNSKSIPNEVIDVLIVRKDYKNSYPEVVKSLIKGWFKSLKYAQDKPRKFAAYASARHQISIDEYIKSMNLLKFPTRKENLKLLDKKSSPLLTSSKKLISVLEELGHPVGGISISHFLNNEFIVED